MTASRLWLKCFRPNIYNTTYNVLCVHSWIAQMFFWATLMNLDLNFRACVYFCHNNSLYWNFFMEMNETICIFYWILAKSLMQLLIVLLTFLLSICNCFITMEWFVEYACFNYTNGRIAFIVFAKQWVCYVLNITTPYQWYCVKLVWHGTIF